MKKKIIGIEAKVLPCLISMVACVRFVTFNDMKLPINEFTMKGKGNRKREKISPNRMETVWFQVSRFWLVLNVMKLLLPVVRSSKICQSLHSFQTKNKNNGTFDRSRREIIVKIGW